MIQMTLGFVGSMDAVPSVWYYQSYHRYNGGVTGFPRKVHDEGDEPDVRFRLANECASFVATRLAVSQFGAVGVLLGALGVFVAAETVGR